MRDERRGRDRSLRQQLVQHRSGLIFLSTALEQLNRRRRHDRRDRVFVDELGMRVAAQQHAEIIEPGDVALQLDSVDEVDGDGDLALAYGVEKRVLKILRSFTHG